jgi:D-sedoheptulose 7-phosphate isomerase
MSNHTESIRANFKEARNILNAFVDDESNIAKISSAIELMAACLKGGGKIISCGNGGSMCDAMHFAEELSGRFRENRHALAAIAISDPSHLTCVANDYGFDHVFSRFIEGMGSDGDVLLAISTSGNSTNVCLAAEAARNRNMSVVGLTGKDGGKLAAFCDVEIRVPFSKYADRVQEIHIKIIHSLIQGIEASV